MAMNLSSVLTLIKDNLAVDVPMTVTVTIQGLKVEIVFTKLE